MRSVTDACGNTEKRTPEFFSQKVNITLECCILYNTLRINQWIKHINLILIISKTALFSDINVRLDTWAWQKKRRSHFYSMSWVNRAIYCAIIDIWPIKSLELTPKHTKSFMEILLNMLETSTLRVFYKKLRISTITKLVFLKL